MQKKLQILSSERRSGGEIAQPPDTKEFEVLKIINDYGHLRITEIARAVWPASKPARAESMASRIIARLLTWRFLHGWPDAFGGISFALTSRGAACLREWGEDARSGLKYSLNRPNFRHRWIGTRYVIERGALGHRAYGAHALITDRAPVGRTELTQRFGILPDGLVLVPDPTSANILLGDWVKVIWSRFSIYDLERMLSIEQHVGASLNAEDTVRLARVLFLCDAESSWLIGALRRYLQTHPRPDRDLHRIVIVRCRVGLPLVWNGYDEIDCAQLMQGDAATGPNIV